MILTCLSLEDHQISQHRCLLLAVESQVGLLRYGWSFLALQTSEWADLRTFEMSLPESLLYDRRLRTLLVKFELSE